MKHPRGISTNLVRRALKLGPTHLTFQFKDFQYNFYIPDEVFRYENLVSLTAKRCRINLNPVDLCCSRLQFLSLESVNIERLDTIFHISKSCPLIEKLSLCHVIYDVGDSGLDLLQTINLHRLTSLELTQVNFDTKFLADLSFIFPSLKDLTLSIVYKDREEILISSTTLERLNVNIYRSTRKMRKYTHRVKLDIPSIRKLTFNCTFIPKLSLIRSNSKGWESHVFAMRRKRLSASWFNRLSNVLNKLRFSRISLTLKVYSRAIFNYEGGDIRVRLSTPEIENLTIYDLENMPTLSCYALFDGLFRICHPKVIHTQYEPSYGTYIIHFLGKRFLDARDAKVSIPNHFMYGLNDLVKEARVQVFDAAVSRWRDVSLKSLLDLDFPIRNVLKDFRFQLKWKQ